MNGRAAEVPRRGGGGTFAVAIVATAAFGLVGGLPDFLGPAVGIAGLVLASFGRRAPAVGPTFGPPPAVVGLGIIAASASRLPSSELFGGLAALALLLWLADDPARPRGGGRRAAVPLASCGLAVGVAWAMTLVLPRPSGEVGVAGGLLAAALLAVGYLVARTVGRPARSGTSA